MKNSYVLITRESGRRTRALTELLKEAVEISDVLTDETAATQREIILGDSNRILTEQAKKMLLTELVGKDGDTAGYAIATDGESYAIYCSDFRAEEAAVTYFKENFPLNDTVRLFPLRAYLKERGEKIKARKWREFEEHLGEYGPEIVKEFKRLYDLFGIENVLWQANLFDPETGMWYFSNSARDTYGYLPSIEETYNALCSLEVTGMDEMLNVGATSALPEWIKKKMGDFLVSCQDEDGFYYNPQWPKEYIIENKCQSRITRDKGSASFMLKSLKREPRYSEAPRVEKPAEKKKESSAPRVMQQFDSVETFRAYLDGLEEKYLKIEDPDKRAYQFYYYGNEFQSIIQYVNQNPEYKRMLIEFFDKYQNPETGVWSDIVCFNAANGLHKIGAVYNSLGVKMKHIDKMVDMVMKVLAIPPEVCASYCYIDIYNIWSCFPYLYTNIMKYGEGTEEERLAEKNAIKKRILAAAAEGIKNSYNQVVGLRMEDGAFSNRYGNTPMTMGCPVAVPDVREGNTASIYSLNHHIFLALDAVQYEIPMCTEYERTVFMDAIEKLGVSGPMPKKKADYRVVAENPDDPRVKACVEKLKTVVDVIEVTTGATPKRVREIVLGEAPRDGASEAKAKLAKALEGKPEGTGGFAIHTIGRFAIAYTDECLMEAAVDYLVSHYPAVNTVRTFDVNDYLKERGKKIIDGKWKAFADALPEEYSEAIVKEFKNLYSLFDDRLVSWWANLFDPERCAFYWSNSARDTIGYKPSLEETYAALSYIGESGMAEMYGGDWAKAIPDWLREGAIEYFRSLQDEDGFYYNPQWPKDFILEHKRQSRMMRDVDTATRTLKMLGAKPKYERKKEEPKKDTKKNDAPRMLQQFESVESFKEYLARLEREYLEIEDPEKRAYKFYQYGNEFQSSREYLGKPEFRGLFFEFLGKHQNPETGLWSDVVCYNATNALHKIAFVYNALGEKLPYIDKMVDGVMKIIALKESECPASGAVEIYNAWSCLPYIYSNIMRFGEGTEEERLAKKNAIKSRVFELAPEAIRAGAEQLRAFKRDDGGFSYDRAGNQVVAQGCRISVSGVCESDVNGCGIATIALKSYIFSALEMGEYEVPLFTEAERVKFINILEDIKKNGAPEKKKLDYNIVLESAENERLLALAASLSPIANIKNIVGNCEPAVTREIILGDSDRLVTKLAKEKLTAALEGAGEDTVGYAIFTAGPSISIVWSDERVAEAAVERLIKRYPTADTTQVFSLKEYLKERGERIKNEKWDALEKFLGEEYGKDIVTELRELYALFPDSLVKWQANLFEPNTGGFYWSNSARDTERYLPSIEETYEAMGFLEGSGMAEMYGNDWVKATPEWLHKKIVDFFYPLQDEDTFFYNPQWPKDYILDNNCQSRITRDRGTAYTILGKLGVEPKYKEQPKKAEPEKKKDDTPRMLKQYESVENFKEYLDGLEKELLAIKDPDKRAYQMYYYGNLFQSTTSYINRSPEFKPIFVEFLEKHQNPENGLWSDIVCFNATNAVHKLGSVYNSIGVGMKHLDKMVDSVMRIISIPPEEKQANGGVDIYNAWSCLPYIYYNILHFGEGDEAERLAKKEEIKKRVLATAAETIRAGVRQLHAFKREDGAYSYGLFGCVAKAQGCPIAYFGGGPESDVNGNGIASLALKHHIFMALEAEEYEVPLYTEYERTIFMDIIENIRKNGQVPKKKGRFTAVTSDPDNTRVKAAIKSTERAIEIVETVTDKAPKVPCEVLFGEVDRDATRAAKKKLDAALEGKDPDTVGFAIYSEGGTHAIVWSDHRIMEVAVKWFTDRFPSAETVKTFSLRGYLKERGEKLIEEKWEALEKHLGKEYGAEITAAIKDLYSLYTNEMVVWLAKLYDPKVGGWYWSNSARDNDGFLPSIEDTLYGVEFIADSGMAEMFDNSWVKATPEWLHKKIIDFIYPLQDEDSFFYHPQWPKEYIIKNNRQSRITRDRGTAYTILRNLGVEPKYKEPERTADAKGAAKNPLWQFESTESFRKFLDELEADYLSADTADKRAYRFYYFGNRFQSTAGYLRENPEFKRMFLEFFEKYRSPVTGMWSEIICYNATNGLHKIACVYNAIGERLPEIEKMVDGIMQVIKLTPEECPAEAGVAVYNAWSCLTYIYENILKYGEGDEAERRARCDAIKRRAFGEAAEAIRASKRQIAGFRREDGSFSYNRSGNQPTAQGCPIAVVGACEGDTDGNVNASLALVDHIFSALDAKDFAVPLFTEYERTIFMDILEELNSKA